MGRTTKVKGVKMVAVFFFFFYVLACLTISILSFHHRQNRKICLLLKICGAKLKNTTNIERRDTQTSTHCLAHI